MGQERGRGAFAGNRWATGRKGGAAQQKTIPSPLGRHPLTFTQRLPRRNTHTADTHPHVPPSLNTHIERRRPRSQTGRRRRKEEEHRALCALEATHHHAQTSLPSLLKEGRRLRSSTSSRPRSHGGHRAGQHGAAAGRCQVQGGRYGGGCVVRPFILSGRDVIRAPLARPCHRARAVCAAACHDRDPGLLKSPSRGPRRVFSHPPHSPLHLSLSTPLFSFSLHNEPEKTTVEYSPFYGIEKGAVLQDARIFHDRDLDPRRCSQVRFCVSFCR